MLGRRLRPMGRARQLRLDVGLARLRATSGHPLQIDISQFDSADKV